MKLELLEIGAETEQLGVCERSLLLGVHSQDNRIADFLKFACEILGADKGFWVFESEPYGWHFSEDACHAFTTHSQKGFSDFFLDQQYIDISHPAIEAFFTIDEETGMTGALGLKGGFLSGEILLILKLQSFLFLHQL